MFCAKKLGGVSWTILKKSINFKRIIAKKCEMSLYRDFMELKKETDFQFTSISPRSTKQTSSMIFYSSFQDVLP